MTREEIIDGLRLLEDNMVYFDELLNDKGEYIDVHELLFEAIKALEQEPCEDAISRKDAINAIKRTVATEQIKELKRLPSVQPKPKTGHWKFIQRGKFIDICCSECGYVSVKDYAYNYTIDQLDEQEKKDFFAKAHMNFCECCGVKMSEIPTDSEKE
jgi:hypothetical protein